tara:strand:+ start:1338 stop:1475 length:138 start_codon:yes stop_codon:yes gene_type:complete
MNMKPKKKMTGYKKGGKVKADSSRKVKIRGTGAATQGLYARGPMG